MRISDWSSDVCSSDLIAFINSSVLDRDGVAEAMRDVDVVHHNEALVAQTDAGRHYWDVNVDGTRIVAEEAAKARVKGAVHISTTAVYGIPPAGTITAAPPLRRGEPYGQERLAGGRKRDETSGRPGSPHK